MLKIENLSKSFHHKKILKKISFSLEAGEHVALLGPNGTGKTTLLKILAGIVRPLSGSGWLLDQKMFTEDSSHRSNLIFWGHASLFYPSLSGLENLKLFFELRNDSISHTQIKEQLEIYHLDKHLFEPIRTYSAGMLQRLSMIKLTLASWQLALIDEPTTGLDVEGLNYLNKLTDSWKSDHKTILFSTHDAAWVKQHAHRILVLKNGVIEENISSPDQEKIEQMMRRKS